MPLPTYLSTDIRPVNHANRFYPAIPNVVWSGVTGLGQVELLNTAADAPLIKEAREAVSPWLWVMSVAGFGMALMNTRRIARMVKGRFQANRRRRYGRSR
jgi:hypothetical protein